MCNIWQTPIKLILYIFTEFKLKNSTPLIEEKGLWVEWVGASNMLQLT